MQDYLATVQSVDDSVGRVLDFLDRNALAKNTIVIYGQPGQDKLTSTLKAELIRLKQAVGDEDQLASTQLPNEVDGPVARLRGK